MPEAVTVDPGVLLRRWRDEWPAVRPPRPDGGFEIGLCMAGAVSAGAYTAGVLDFFIEALDALQAEREQRQRDGRPALHQPVLSVLGGASAGGMCAAIGAIFLDADFPPARQDARPEDRRRNPLWRAWVEDVDIAPMLGNADVRGGGALTSLLDCTVLDGIVDTLLREREGMQPRRRPWLADPLRAVLTLANLRGVPYALRFEGSAFQHWMAQHADHVAFAIPLQHGVEAVAGDAIRIGECPLDRLPPQAGGGLDNFRKRREAFKAVALGTGAFPVALAPRVLGRDAANYLYRAALTPNGPLARNLPIDPFPNWAKLMQPAWNPAPETGELGYRALCVDGGAMNNEPLDLVRRMISGYVGRPPQMASQANRAMLMIDPFVKPGRGGPESDKGLLGSILPLFNALIANSRFKAEDLALAADPQVGSRFLIAPSRGNGWEAEGAIAAGHLGGFLGFFARAYREHDFFLGRRNAQAFLRRRFALPQDNPLFTRGGWGEQEIKQWGVPQGKAEGEDAGLSDGKLLLPVIPLCGTCAAVEERQPPWPAGRFDAESVRPLVKARASVAGKALRRGLNEGPLSGGGFGARLGRGALWVLLPLVLPRIVDAAMEKIAGAVAELNGKGPGRE